MYRNKGVVAALPPPLPKCHPTVKGGWALRSYEEVTRTPGDIFDLTYHGDNGNEIAFMVLILQQDGVTLLPQSGDVRISHQPSSTKGGDQDYHERNQRLIDSHYTQIKGVLLAAARLYETGALVPVVGDKALVPVCPTCRQCTYRSQ